MYLRIAGSHNMFETIQRFGRFDCVFGRTGGCEWSWDFFKKLLNYWSSQILDLNEI